MLLLDGIEPLQHPVDTMNGEMADVGMNELLLQLHHHRHAQSFVLISSRQPLVALADEDWQDLQQGLELKKLLLADPDRLGL